MGKIRKWFYGVLLLVFVTVAATWPSMEVCAGSTSAPDFQMKGNTLIKYTGTASVVTVPTYVKNIGDEAFAGHSEIVRINLPGYMEEIGYSAFEGCTSLEKIIVPDTVTKIGTGAFSGCSNLKSVTFGKKLSKIGTGIFSDCTSLNVLNLHKNNDTFSYDDGVVYDKEKTIAYCMLPGYDSGVYRMPLTVKQIKGYAFWGCPNLTKVEIGGNVKEIPDYAFANCENLQKVMVSYSVYRIGIGAFANNKVLQDVEIPVSVSTIHDTAFSDCPQINIIAQEDSVATEYKNMLLEKEKNVPEKTNRNGENQEIEENEEAPAPNINQAVKQQGVTKGDGKLLGETRVVNGRAVITSNGNVAKVFGGG